MKKTSRSILGKPRASMMAALVESLAELPPRKTLVAYVREGKRRNWKYERGC